MPKYKVSDNTRLNSFVNHFGREVFSTDGTVLFCKICEVKVAADKKFTVEQHISRNKHVKGVELKKIQQEQNTNRVKQQDRTKNTPRKSFLSKILFVLIIILSLLGGLLFNNFNDLYNYFNTNHLSEAKLKSTMMSLKEHFPDLQRGMIKKLGGAFSRLQTPGEPIVFMLLHNDANKQSTDCLASYASILAKQNIFTNTGNGLWMNGSEWTSYSNTDHEDFLYEKLNSLLEKNKVLVLENLQDLPWSLAKSLHYLCDSENPKYAMAMYMLELRVNGDLQQLSDGEKLVAAEAAMNLAWQDTPNEYRAPLIARLTSYVDTVEWESNEACLAESFIRISPE